MKKRNKAILVISLFLIFAVAISLFVSLNLDFFKSSIEGYIAQFGYLGILVFSFILDFLEQPIGPDLPIIAGVAFGLNILLVVLFAIIGSYASSILNFYIGHGVLSKKVRSVCNLRGHKYCELFERHGKVALFLASITPVPWVAFCWLAGSFGLRFRDFVIYGLIPRALRFYAVATIIWYFRFVLI